jgi:hypothetical protein
VFGKYRPIDPPYLKCPHFNRLRAKIQAFIAQHFADDSSNLTQDMTALSDQANRIFCQHNAHQPANATSTGSVLNGPLAGPAMFVKYLYHLSLIILHSSVVPLFSGRPLSRFMPRDSLQKGAETIIRHVIAITVLLDDLIARDTDLTRMGPVVGYSAFVAGSVLTICEKSLRCGHSSGSQINVPRIDSKTMVSVRTVLRTLSLYWKILERLVSC